MAPDQDIGNGDDSLEIFPFREKRIDLNRFIRIFSSNVNPSELTWHKDKRNRVITVLSGTNWKLQRDNEMPLALILGISYEILKETYHRILRGEGDLVLEIEERD